MKTKELIKQLQALDPTGEEEVCIANSDILFIERLPAYYDGVFEVLKRDPVNTSSYNIIGVEFRSKGQKIKIVPHGIEDVLLDEPEMPVYYDSMYSEEHRKDRVKQLREQYRELNKRIEDNGKAK